MKHGNIVRWGTITMLGAGLVFTSTGQAFGATTSENVASAKAVPTQIFEQTKPCRTSYILVQKHEKLVAFGTPPSPGRPGTPAKYKPYWVFVGVYYSHCDVSYLNAENATKLTEGDAINMIGALGSEITAGVSVIIATIWDVLNHVIPQSMKDNDDGNGVVITYPDIVGMKAMTPSLAQQLRQQNISRYTRSMGQIELF